MRRRKTGFARSWGPRVFEAGRDVVAFIAQQVEGNLLAARQELEKIALMAEDKALTLDAVSRVMTDSSHYSLKELTEVLATRQTARLVRILRGLEKEDVKPPLLLWAMTEQVRRIAKARQGSSAASSRTSPLARLSRVHRQCVGVSEGSRAPGSADLLRQCAWVDRVIKGRGDGNPWHELIQLGIAIQLAG